MAYSGKKYGKERGYCFVHGLWEQYLHLLRYLEYKTALFHKIDSLRSWREIFFSQFYQIEAANFSQSTRFSWLNFFFANSSG